VTEDVPPNVSVRSEPAMIAPLRLPQSDVGGGDHERRGRELFVNFTRTCEPPSVVQTIVRSVWFFSWLGTVDFTVVVDGRDGRRLRRPEPGGRPGLGCSSSRQACARAGQEHARGDARAGKDAPGCTHVQLKMLRSIESAIAL
jgi:hypothetical protein